MKKLDKPPVFDSIPPPLVWTCPDGARLLRRVAPRHRLIETGKQTRNVREGDRGYYW